MADPDRLRHAFNEELPGRDLRPRAADHSCGDIRGGAELPEPPSRGQRGYGLYAAVEIGPSVSLPRSRSVWWASIFRCRHQSATTAMADGRIPLSAILTDTGEDSIRFFTRTKVVTQRWPRSGPAPGFDNRTAEAVREG